ncbi:MAG: hypothetical protein ISS81_02370 [Candidatus Marinimicrobia bacterium]|nr:hypothetical protein [Candidatus Neomarinimicrobiota bacterium]
MMKLNHCNNYFLLSGTIIFLIFLSSCNREEINSTWKDNEIAIDGYFKEWENNLHFIKNEKIAIGVSNYESDLYLCLVSSDRGVMSQIMRSGFTVWFDPKGKNHKTFGIKYPTGMQQDDMFMMRDMMGERDFNRDERNRFGDQIDLFENTQTHFELLGPKKDDIMIIPILNNQGIQVKLGRSQQQLVYELKVPLTQTPEHPDAINASPDQQISIGFETGKFERPEMRGNMTRGMGSRSPGGVGGRPGGGMRGGSPGGMGRGMGRGMPEQLKVWIKVNLASSISDSSSVQKE